MEWMTAANAPKAQKEALKGSIFSHRFERIFRTGGEKSAAVAGEGAQRRLIGPDQEQDKSFHEISL